MTPAGTLGTIENMDTITASRNVPDSARASIAAALSSYYAELAGAEQRAEPPFSLRRTLLELSKPHGLRDGREAEVARGAALLNGEHHDVNRPLVPLRALRTLVVGTPSAGGFLVDSTNAANALDVLRGYSVVAESGVQVLEGLVGNAVLPRVATAATAAWVNGELTDATETQPVLGAQVLQPRQVAAVVGFSRQWLLQTGEAGEQLIREQLLRAVAARVDVAFFSGNGSGGAPVGLLSTTGIGTQAGASLSHAGTLAMRRQVLAAGGREERLRWLGTPTVQEVLGARARTSGEKFIWDDGRILNAPAHAAATVPSGTLVCGDFGSAYVAFFGAASARIEVNPYSADFISGKLQAKVSLHLDFGFAQPSAFCAATSVS